MITRLFLLAAWTGLEPATSCLMGEATLLYQLRDKTDYVVASVETLPNFGYPYHKVVPALFTQPHADLYNFTLLSTAAYSKEVLPSTFEYFTVGVYRMAKMEALAAEVNKAMTRLNMKYTDLLKYAYANTVSAPDKQVLFYPHELPNALLFFDFAVLAQKLEEVDATAAAALRQVVEQVVVQKYAQSGTLDLTLYQQLSLGMSLYLPYPTALAPGVEQLNRDFYTRFGWSAAAGLTRQWE